MPFGHDVVEPKSRRMRPICLTGLALIVALAATAGSAAAAPTVVTLGFDNNYASQYKLALPLLNKYGFKAAFQINSCRVQGPPKGAISCPRGVTPDPDNQYMTWDQVRAIYLQGHEIVGHSLYHKREDDVNERARNICTDRRNLLSLGFAVSDFAYPDTTSALDTAIVQGCGYNASRVSRGLRSASCPDCPVAQALPPANRFDLLSAVVESPVTPDSLMQTVADAAASGGGWVHFAFQYICASCDVTAATLDGFLARLRNAAPAGTTVQTIDQVVSGSLQPVPGQSAADLPPPRPGTRITAVEKDTVSPRIAQLSLSRRSFRVKRAGAPRSGRGTVIRYVLSEQPATVKFTFARQKGKRYVAVGSLTRRVTKLSNRLAFGGRLRSKALKPGRYRMSVSATDAAGNRSAVRSVTFRVRAR